MLIWNFNNAYPTTTRKKKKKQQNQAAFLNDDVTCMDLDQQGQT